ncbi:MAG: YdcF family protein [Rubrivivax sp.]|nr:YdcF family protein [Rubrivivax sp.]
MNEIFSMLGVEHWKGTLTALILPPVPFLLLILAGARVLALRRGLGWSLLLLGVAGIWASSTTAVGSALTRHLLAPPPALSASDITELRRSASARTAIVVLGAGRELLAPEYGVASLKHYTLERLRYGLWLSRETGLSLGFSGGIGHGAKPGPSEAEVAQRIVEREYGRKLAWIEAESRDTVENAQRSVALLRAAGVQRVVVVTHGFHMPRALAAFERAARRDGPPIAVLTAPMGMASLVGPTDTDWLPSGEGFESTRMALREWLGRLMGA